MLHFEEIHSQERPSELVGNTTKMICLDRPFLQIVLHTRNWKQPILQYSLKCSRSFVVVPMVDNLQMCQCFLVYQGHGVVELTEPYTSVVSETPATLHHYQGIDTSCFSATIWEKFWSGEVVLFRVDNLVVVEAINLPKTHLICLLVFFVLQPITISGPLSW